MFSFSRFVITIGQVILAVIVISFVLYRLALSYDMVPEGFSPSGIVSDEYTQFKANLASDAQADDYTSKFSLIMFNSIKQMEKIYKERQARAALNAKMEAQCQENAIFRFFMFMGKDSKDVNHCIKKNMQLENSVKNLDTSVKSPAPTNQYNNGKAVISPVTAPDLGPPPASDLRPAAPQSNTAPTSTTGTNAN